MERLLRAGLPLVSVLTVFSSGIACKGGGESKTDKPTAYEPSEPCTPLPPIGRRLWRLSVQQYANSVRDLLDLDSPPVLATAGGTSESAFFSDSSATVDENLAFQLNLTARKVTSALTPRIPALAACTSGETEEACARRFAGRFGARAFRRPLDEGEITGLMAVYADGRQQDFATGISLVIQALLQSPSFMFRSELGAGAGDTTLTGHEVATQLAYMFLDSTPDEGLLAAAADGRLNQPEGIASEVDRLMSLDAVKRNVTRIVLDWFNTRQAFIIAKAPDHFFALPAADRDQTILQQDVYASARALVDDVLWTRGESLTSLITTERMFVNQRLATLLGLPFTGSAPEELEAVDTIPGERAGLLTHPAVLWAASGTDQTSIVRRGILLHNDIVCADTLPFPEGLINSPDVQSALAMLPTEIEKSDYRLATPPCKGCHSQIDPFGLVLENFDAVGRYRTEAEGWVVNPSADFSLMPGIGRVVHGPVDLAKAIVDSRQFLGCAAQKMASYAIGRMIRAYNTCEVRTMRAALPSSDGTASALLRQVATAPFLRTRAGGTP
jgi:hypothetical protein